MTDPLDDIGWGVFEDEGTNYVHVIPMVSCEPDEDEDNDGWIMMPPHILSLDCPCHPEEDEGVVTHNMIH